jgi:tRNA-specific 2-thiouridylase
MRIAVAMSGGVDSSVTAALLKAQGHEVLGLTMKLWGCASDPHNPERERELFARAKADLCCSPRDIQDAAGVCRRLGIEHHVLDLAEPFAEEVILPFVREYLRGRTPNPCVRCNERIKSRALLAAARALGAEALATGHYARIDRAPDGLFRLRGAADAERDQTYFLLPLGQAELAALRFPLGELGKQEVRRHAAELGLAVAAKPDSQEVCFIRDNDHRRFLREYEEEAFRPGPILLKDGTQVGTHEGLPGYTIGQRRGLRVAWREPLYVIALDVERNAVVLGPADALWADGLEARELHWVAGAAPGESFRTEAKIRYRNAPNPCTVTRRADGSAEVCFEKPVRAVTPGQAVVFYEGDVVLGGGWIEGALRAVWSAGSAGRRQTATSEPPSGNERKGRKKRSAEKSQPSG